MLNEPVANNNESWLYRVLNEAQHDQIKQAFSNERRKIFDTVLNNTDQLRHIQNRLMTGSDLRIAGLYGAHVELIEGHDGFCSLPKGAKGCIGWTYPSSEGMFDFRQEAPVTHIDIALEKTIGIPWAKLKVLRTRRS